MTTANANHASGYPHIPPGSVDDDNVPVFQMQQCFAHRYLTRSHLPLNSEQERGRLLARRTLYARKKGNPRACWRGLCSDALIWGDRETCGGSGCQVVVVRNGCQNSCKKKKKQKKKKNEFVIKQRAT
jgi:hypothetical protein